MEGGLSNLFSSNAQERFARTYKPQEFVPAVKAKVEVEEQKKQKKPKHKHAAAAAAAAAAVETEEGDSSVQEQQEEQKSSNCTLFVGNIPITESVKSITKLFSKYGEVLSVRMRSVPTAGAKVDDAGNQNLVKKVCVNSGKFGEQKGSYNAYVVFKEESSIAEALKVNNTKLGDRHIRVDREKPSLFDTKCTVFLGGLPHYADEEELREHFAKALPNGQKDIVGVRIVRDPATLVGKGFGYLLLADRDAVGKALTLHQATYKKRWDLRVTLCGKRTKRSDAAASERKKALSSSVSSASGVVADLKGNASTKVGGKKRGRDGDDDDADHIPQWKKDKMEKKDHPAARRIKVKGVITKSKYLKERTNTVKVAGKKGKRLGGVVKRAMKAAATKGGK